MNLQDDTIQLLVDLVEKEQRRLDQFQPDSQDYARRFSCPDGPLYRRSAFAKRAFGAGGPPRSHQLPPQALLFPGRCPAGPGFGQYRRFAGPVNLEKSVELWYF